MLGCFMILHPYPYVEGVKLPPGVIKMVKISIVKLGNM